LRQWSVLFGLAFVASLGVFLYAPFDDDWWLPNYWATHRQYQAPMTTTARILRALAEEQAAIAREAEGAQAAKDMNPERLANLARRESEVAGRAEVQRATAADLASRNVLTGRTRAAARSVATAIGSASKAPEALEKSDLEGALPGLLTARDALDEAATTLERALTESREPSSRIARDVDHLFVIIFVITGVVFVATHLALVYATWRYRARPGRKAVHSHGNFWLELIWTLIPTAALIFLAFYQIGIWARIKYDSSMPARPPLARVTGRQFQWLIRYPGPDGRIGTADDLRAVNELHLVKDEPVVIELESQDVLHSFFVPQIRLKQDAVPGLTIPVWFDVDKAGQYELVCAELCGWGHNTMLARLIVHETRDDFERWQGSARAAQEQDRAPSQVAAAREGAIQP
jgi:cytochrome c oxidase subunit 2